MSPSGAGRCETALPVEQPALGSRMEQAPMTSRWAARVDVALARLRTELDRGLPVDLAKGQSQSSGGRVSYSVRRQGLELRVEQGELLVEVPVTGQASACVPIGPICPSVGSCSPALQVTAHVPLDLGPDLALRARNVDIKMTRGCVIAGVDASSRIQSGAGQYSEKIRQRLNEILPTIRPEVDAAWQGLKRPVPLGEGRCVSIVPERVVYRSIEPPTGSLSFAVAIDGRIEPPTSCPAAATAVPLPLPKASRLSELAPETSLAAPRTLDWTALAGELDRSLVAAGPPPRGAPSAELGPLRVLEARGSSDTSSPRIALRIGLGGSLCGELWLYARPELTADGAAIGLTDVALVAGQPARASLVRELGIEPWIARHAFARLAPRSDAVAKQSRATIAEACHARSPEPRLAWGDAATSPGSVVIATDGLVAYETERFGPSITIE